MRGVIITFSFLFFFACSESDRREHQIEPQSTHLAIQRLDQELFNNRQTDSILRFLQKYQTFSMLFLHSEQYPDESILAERMARLLSEPSMDTLYREVQGEYSDLQFLSDDLGLAIGRMKILFPETPEPIVQTAVTGLYNDLYISDSLIIIGLDFFLGSDASYPPMDIPMYIAKRYDKPFMVSIITKFLAGQKVTNGKSETLLSEMIDFGKTYYLTSRLIPDTPDSILLGYTTEEMNIVVENEPIIWANFVENEILYETSHVTKKKFLGERPNVYEISQKCPGRIGAWVGWRIVESYMQKNSEVGILDLLSSSDNEQIFRQSGYKPQSR